MSLPTIFLFFIYLYFFYSLTIGFLVGKSIHYDYKYGPSLKITMDLDVAAIIMYRTFYVTNCIIQYFKTIWPCWR